MCSNHKGILNNDKNKRKDLRGSSSKFEDNDDFFLSQAYDDFLKTNSTQDYKSQDQILNTTKITDDLITLDDLIGCPPTSRNAQNNYEEDLPQVDLIGFLLTSQHEPVTEDFHSLSTSTFTIRPESSKENSIVDKCNKPVTKVKSLRQLATDVLNLANNDNDLCESSFIATVILLEIFDKAIKTAKPLRRWKKCNPANWKVTIAKKRRAEGLPYNIKNKIRPAKIPKPINCIVTCKFKCSTFFNEDVRQVFCRKYWSLGYIEQKNFLLANIDVKEIKTTTLQRKRNTKRSYSTDCFFKVDGKKVQVCQKFFCSTLCISISVVQNALKNRDTTGFFNQERDRRGAKAPANKTPTSKVEEVKRHIESFPTMQSHYVRKDSRRRYLDCKLSIGKMYQLYASQNIDPVSEITYRRIFGSEYNLGFFTPKKDQCLLCTRVARGDAKFDQGLEANYNEHIARKEACNNEKKKDKERASTDKKFVSVSFDLQSILQIPSGDVGLLYYVRKLTVYNLTIYESALPNNAFCFTWSEVNGKKGSCEIGTILYHYLSKCVPDYVSEVSLFSDTCGGQNRNKYVAAILFWAVQNIENIQIIEQKFLESGHSFMQADSMHSSIEMEQKNTAIYSMPDWINVFKRARSKKSKKDPYFVKEFKFNEFKDLKELADKILLNTQKDIEGKQVKWLKIKKLKYVKGENKVYFNYDMSDIYSTIDVKGKKGSDEIDATTTPEHSYSTRNKKKKKSAITACTPLPSTSSTMPYPELQQLYTAPLKISVAKKKDLLQLCSKGVIPEEYHAWFQQLNTDETAKDMLPDLTASDDDDITPEED